MRGYVWFVAWLSLSQVNVKESVAIPILPTALLSPLEDADTKAWVLISLDFPTLISNVLAAVEPIANQEL